MTMISLALSPCNPVIGSARIASLPISLPVAPVLFAGTARMSGWSGNAIQASKVNLATQDIGFVDDRLDLAAIETFAGGQNIEARAGILYDQSGNGFNLTQSTYGARAKVYRSQLVGDALPFTCGPNIQWTIPSGLTVDRANHSAFLVVRPHLSKANFYWLSLGSNFRFGTPTPDDNPNGGVRLWDTANSVQKFSSKVPRSGVSVLGYSSSGSNVKFYIDGTIETVASAFASATLTGGVVENGNGYSEIFQVVVFNRALTDAEMTAVGSRLALIAPPTIGQTQGVMMIGDSITAGQGSVAVYSSGYGMTATEPDQLAGKLGDPGVVSVFNLGQPSITAAAWNNDKARDIPPLMSGYPDITKWVARVHVGINDLRGGTVDTTIITAISTLCSYLQGLGVKVIVSTINEQGIIAPYTEQAETYRQSVNTSIRANYATYADDIVDYDGITELQDPTNTTYFASDQLHQTAASYDLKSDLLLPKVQALLAA